MGVYWNDFGGLLATHTHVQRYVYQEILAGLMTSPSKDLPGVT